MFEVIFSVFHDAHIMRPITTNSTIRPLFIGTFDECAKYLSNCR